MSSKEIKKHGENTVGGVKPYHGQTENFRNLGSRGPKLSSSGKGGREEKPILKGEFQNRGPESRLYEGRRKL